MGYRDARVDRPRPVRRGLGPASGYGPRHPRAALLPAPAGDFQSGRAGGAASAAAGRPETGPGSGAGAGAGLLARAARLAPSAVSERLAAFGFSDATRTRDAVVELTQGFSRTSRLMRTMVPLLLDWLSESPDPDLGLLGLRRLATGPHRRTQLSNLFRESPEAARHLCLLLGTSPLFATGYERHPDQLALLGNGLPSLPRRDALERRALDGIAWAAAAGMVARPGQPRPGRTPQGTGAATSSG